LRQSSQRAAVFDRCVSNGGWTPPLLERPAFTSGIALSAAPSSRIV
jgi:hypothetical protein